MGETLTFRTIILSPYTDKKSGKLLKGICLSNNFGVFGLLCIAVAAEGRYLP